MRKRTFTIVCRPIFPDYGYESVVWVKPVRAYDEMEAADLAEMECAREWLGEEEAKNAADYIYTEMIIFGKITLSYVFGHDHKDSRARLQ